VGHDEWGEQQCFQPISAAFHDDTRCNGNGRWDAKWWYDAQYDDDGRQNVGIMPNAMVMAGMQNGMVTNGGMMPPIIQTGDVGNTTTSQNQAIMPSPDASNQNQALAPPTAASFNDQAIPTQENASAGPALPRLFLSAEPLYCCAAT
jgi:hypothetical protein